MNDEKGLRVSWLALTLCCDAERAEVVSDRLSEAGAVSVSLSEAGGAATTESGHGAESLWTRTRVSGLFAAGCDLTQVIAELTEAGFGKPTLTAMEDTVWEQSWRQHVPPARYGRRLWVLPSFAEPVPGDAVCVRLDPGLAFGTGTHPTTGLCLAWLDSLELNGLELIDYGCGSGILAIAAAKLGAAAVRAVDNDNRALETARDNARRNRCAERIDFYPPERLPLLPADILVANIFADPLVALRAEISSLLRPGGRIALSGILAAQADAVTQAYRVDFDLDPITQREGWVRIDGRRKTSGHK